MPKSMLAQKIGTKAGSPMVIQLWRLECPRGKVRFKIACTGCRDYYVRQKQRAEEDYVRKAATMD